MRAQRYLNKKKGSTKMTKIKISDLSEAVARLEDAEKMGAELLHFNGGQWFVKSNDETVSVYTTADIMNLTKEIGSVEWSKKYIANNKNALNFKEKIEAFKNCI
jgi:hypothetical protein